MKALVKKSFLCPSQPLLYRALPLTSFFFKYMYVFFQISAFSEKENFTSLQEIVEQALPAISGR